MSENSNLGYGEIQPYEVSSYINTGSMNNPYHFGSNETNRFLRGGTSVSKTSVSKTNAKKMKKKIKNITTKYKMKKKNIGSLKKRLSRFLSKSIAAARSRSGGKQSNKKRSNKKRSNKKRSDKKRQTKKQRGGYHQYGSNISNTPSYSTGGVLSSQNSALANPVPYQLSSNDENCPNAYRH